MNSGLVQERKQSVVQTDKRQHSDRRQVSLTLSSYACYLFISNTFCVNEKKFLRIKLYLAPVKY